MPAKRAPVTNSAFYCRVAGYACYIVTVFGLLIFGLYYGIFSASSSSPEQQQSSASSVNERHHNRNTHHHRRSAVAFRFDMSNQLFPNNQKTKKDHDNSNKFQISDQSQKLFEEGGSHLVSSFSILNGEEEFNLNNNNNNKREHDEINSPSAFVTIIYSEADIIPAMTLLHSLKKTDSKILNRVVLVVSSSTFSSSLKSKINSLTLLATHVLEIDPIPSPFFTSSADDPQRFSSKDEFTKLRLFELIQFRKVLFVDCHSVLVRNIDYLLLLDYDETTVIGPSMILEDDAEFSSRMMIVHPSLSSLHYLLGEVLYKLSAADRSHLARARDPVAFLLRLHQFKKQVETEVVDRSVLSKWNLLDIASDSDFQRLDDPRIRGVFLSSSSSSSSSPNLLEHDDEPLPWVKTYFDESLTNYREVTFQERFIEVLPFTASLTRRLGLQLRHDQEEDNEIRNHDHSSSSFNDWLVSYHDHEDVVDHSSIRRRSGYYIWFAMFHTLLSDIVHFINKATDLSSSSTSSSLLHQKIFTKVGGNRRLTAGVVLRDPEKWLLEISQDIVHEVEASSSSSSSLLRPDSEKFITSTKQLINDTLQQKGRIEVVCDTCMFHPEFGYHYYTDCENVIETNNNNGKDHQDNEALVNEFYSSSAAGGNQRKMNDENKKVMHVTRCSDSSCEECSWIGVFGVGDVENRELFSENALQNNKNNRHRHRDRISLKNQREYSLKLLGRGRSVDRKKFDWIIKSEEVKKKKTSSIFDDQRVLRSHHLPLEFQQQTQLLYLIPIFSTSNDLLQIHCDKNNGRISLKRKGDQTTMLAASSSSSSSSSNSTIQFNLKEEFTQRTVIPRLLGSARFSSLSPSFSSQTVLWTLSCVRADAASIFSIGVENASNNASSSTTKRRRRKPTARTNNINNKQHYQKMHSLVFEISLYNPNCIEAMCSSSSTSLATVLNFETCECFSSSTSWFSTSESSHRIHHHGGESDEGIIKSFKRVYDGETFDHNVMTDFFFASSTSSSVSSPEESASSNSHYFHSLISNDKLLVAPVKYICEQEDDDDDEGTCSTSSTPSSVEVQIFLKKPKRHDEHYPNFALDGDEILTQLQNAMEEKFYQHHSKLMSFMNELFSVNDDEEDNDNDKNEEDNKNNKKKKRRGRSHFHHHHNDVLPWFVKFILMILIVVVSVYCVVTMALWMQRLRQEACRKKVMDRKAV